MDVKNAFLNGFIQEEVYVEQPPCFEDVEKPDHVFKLHKALYGLKQALKAWNERLSKFLVEKGYVRGSIDTTLFIKRYVNDLIVVQIYVDDIVFGATNEALCKNFTNEMQGEFEMSMMGELKYFLGLQFKQNEEGIFINQERYTQYMLKRFDMLKLKPISTPMSSSTKLDPDEKGKNVDEKFYRGIWYSRESTLGLVRYSDADFASSKIDRKSTSGTCQFEYSTFKNRSYRASLVKEFYASIALGDEELDDSDDYIENGLNVYLNGKEFVVIADDLGNLLKVECEEGEFEFPKKYDPSSLWEIITWKKEKYSSKSNAGLITSPQIRILHYFVAANIHGKSGSLSYISLQDLC
ncbi:Reverse transcriptase [Theobroma cacao]|nr:Reverse transcriptase [Theobroma cacao]